jgi:hypothetical protein
MAALRAAWEKWGLSSGEIKAFLQLFHHPVAERDPVIEKVK